MELSHMPSHIHRNMSTCVNFNVDEHHLCWWKKNSLKIRNELRTISISIMETSEASQKSHHNNYCDYFATSIMSCFFSFHFLWLPWHVGWISALFFIWRIKYFLWFKSFKFFATHFCIFHVIENLTKWVFFKEILI